MTDFDKWWYNRPWIPPYDDYDESKEGWEDCMKQHRNHPESTQCFRGEGAYNHGFNGALWEIIGREKNG